MGTSDKPFVLYGQSFEDVEEGDGISKKPLAIENQIVTDEKGRRRFHGAFTGGFSAGYFNTVGSVEGFVPSTFVSNRAARGESKALRRPEDFMDKEDLGEYGIAPRQIQTTKDFSEESSAKEKDRKRRLAWEHTELAAEADLLADLIKPVSDSVGVLMLKKMGWRPGKGVGPMISRGSTDAGFVVPKDFKFAPDDVDFHVFEPKADLHGLGYSGLDSSILQKPVSKETAVTANKKQKKGIQGQAFGVGAFEEDDDDIYSTEDLSKYDFALSTLASSSVDRNISVDDDFEIGKITLTPRKFFPPPKISRDYVPSVPFVNKKSTETTNLRQKDSSSLNPNQRSFLLGESSSVWSLVSQKDRNRIEDVKNISKEPQKHSSSGDGRTSRFDRKTPPLKKDISRDNRREKEKEKEISMFLNDPSKRKRFDEFLNYTKRGLCMPQRLDATDWEWESEQDEFRALLSDDLKEAYAGAKLREKPLFQASISQPFAMLMKSKFTTAALGDEEESEKQPGVDHDKVKAVQLKMFGPMTREKHEWHPHRNLCKRFNLPNPYPESRVTGVPYFQKDVKAKAMQLVGEMFHSTAAELSDRENAEKDKRGIVSEKSDKNVPVEESSEISKTFAFIEKFGDSKEEERPPMELFKKIFASSSSESENESETDKIDNVKQMNFNANQVEKNAAQPEIMCNEENVANLNKDDLTDVNVNFETQLPDISTEFRREIVPESEYGPALPDIIADDDIKKSERGSAADVKKKKKRKHHHHRHGKSNKSEQTKKHASSKHKSEKRSKKRKSKKSSSYADSTEDSSSS